MSKEKNLPENTSLDIEEDHELQESKTQNILLEDSDSLDNNESLAGNERNEDVEPNCSATDNTASKAKSNHVEMIYYIEDIPPWYLCILLGFQVMS